MRLYECNLHGEDFELGKQVSCPCCIMILERIQHNREVSKRTPRTGKLRMDVYWPGAVGAQGRTIEHLEHKPVHFDSKDKFRDYLKSHNVRQAG